MQSDVPLAPLSTLGVGGPARWLLTATTIEDVAAAHARPDASVFILGGGSNLVIADAGFDGLVVRIALAGVTATRDGDDVLVTAGAGEAWDRLVELAVSRDLTGLECLSGIPGTVGGTPIQNVGAYGQEVSDVIESLVAFDRAEGRTVTLTAGECGFGYRTSRFKQHDADRFVVCTVTFRLRRGVPPSVAYPDVVDDLRRQNLTAPSVRDVRAAVLRVRRRKGMVIDDADPDTRSVGSFFMNPIVDRAAFERIDRSRGSTPHFLMDNDTVKIPAAWLIEQSGFHRGHVDGHVGLSTKHPLAIINRGGATARDVIRLARRIKSVVRDRFDVTLRPEPVFVGFGDDPDIQYLRG